MSIWLAYSNLTLGVTSAEEGQFGDKFGALNTLFTGFALVGLLATLVHQHDERQASAADHATLISAHDANTDALNQQIIAQRAANYLTALVSRIEAYSHQQQLYKYGNGEIPKNLIDEQDGLLWELGAALNEARRVAKFDENLYAKERAVSKKS